MRTQIVAVVQSSVERVRLAPEDDRVLQDLVRGKAKQDAGFIRVFANALQAQYEGLLAQSKDLLEQVELAEAAAERKAAELQSVVANLDESSAIDVPDVEGEGDGTVNKSLASHRSAATARQLQLGSDGLFTTDGDYSATLDDYDDGYNESEQGGQHVESGSDGAMGQSDGAIPSDRRLSTRRTLSDLGTKGHPSGASAPQYELGWVPYDAALE
jgi:hypothetical protein